MTLNTTRRLALSLLLISGLLASLTSVSFAQNSSNGPVYQFNPNVLRNILVPVLTQPETPVTSTPVPTPAPIVTTVPVVKPAVTANVVNKAPDVAAQLSDLQKQITELKMSNQALQQRISQTEQLLLQRTVQGK